MKKLIFIFLIPAVISCSKNMGTGKYAGTWNGHYSTTAKGFDFHDSGSIRIVIDASNNASASLQSLHGGNSTTMNGTINPSSGALVLSSEEMLSQAGSTLTGTLSGDAGSGTLAYPWASTSTWFATKN